MHLRNLRFGNHRFATKIDIVAENELDQQAIFIEVKRNIKNYNPELLHSKIAAFTRATGEFKNYNVIQKGVSLEDIWRNADDIIRDNNGLQSGHKMPCLSRKFEK